MGTGFMGNNCEIDIDECLTENISCGGLGTCINTKGSYKCQCNEGMCGTDCNLTDPCQENESPCMNGGLCVETCTIYPDYKCQCMEGFGGKNCTEQVIFIKFPKDFSAINYFFLDPCKFGNYIR